MSLTAHALLTYIPRATSQLERSTSMSSSSLSKVASWLIWAFTSHVLSEERRGTYLPLVLRCWVVATTKCANDINKERTWAKPYRLSPISQTQFRFGSNAFPRSQQMILERSQMCVLVCIVPEHRKKSTLLTDSLQVELVCVYKPRKCRQSARISPFSSFWDLQSARGERSAISRVCPSLRHWLSFGKEQARETSSISMCPTYLCESNLPFKVLMKSKNNLFRRTVFHVLAWWVTADSHWWQDKRGGEK